MQPSWKTDWQILIKSNIYLPCDLVMQFTDLHPKENRFTLGLNVKVHSSFIYNSLTLDTTHTSDDWWMGEQMEYVHTREY